MKKTKRGNRLDDIDLAIIEELADNPRKSLINICNGIKKKNVSVSVETVRKRISNLYDELSFRLMPNRDSFDFDTILLMVKVTGGKKIRKKVILLLMKMCAFGIEETIGNYDVISFVAIKKGSDLSKIIDDIKEVNEVEVVDHLFITKSHRNKYALHKINHL